MRATLLVAFLLVSGWAFAQSQRPPDSQVGNKPASNQQPTINVTVASPEKTAAELEREEKRRQEDLAINTAQLDFNARLFWVSAFQSVIAVIAIIVSYFALRTSNAQARIALAAKRNMDRQTQSMKAQLAATESAADTAHKALIIANPPQIIVRDIRSPFAQELATFVAGDKPREDKLLDIAFRDVHKPMDERRSITASLLLTNTGRSKAKILNSDCRLFTSKGRPVENPSDESLSFFPTMTLAPGKSERVDAPAIVFDANNDPMVDLAFRSAELWLVGVIVYTDELGNLHRTGFRRLFNTDTARFQPLSELPAAQTLDTDWEYQD